MADRSVLFRIRAALQGAFVAVADEVELLATHVGLISGVNNVGTALQRFDGTGIGAAIFRFTGAYSAQASNISEWFGGKQLVRLRCTDSGTGPSVSGAVRFDLPGTSALNTAFDALVTAGLPEQITFIIEYTGPSDDFLQIFPRVSPSPQISGVSSIVVRTGVAATIEITRASSILSDYTFLSIGGVGNGGATTGDSVKLINPSVAVWNANTNGVLPTTGVVKGNAYRVANAPADGSGRFGEVMQDLDWVVWNGESFTSWSAEPHQWFVIPAHDVRRITALETEFLNDVAVSTQSDRNTILRGDNYADTAGEIRLKIYDEISDYSAADLNTTGDIDEYTDPADKTGHLAIRLTGTQASLASVLPTLYVFAEDSGTFAYVASLGNDFIHEGDFVSESDYITRLPIAYGGGTFLRIYFGTPVDRYNLPNLDISESNLDALVQAKLNRTDGQGTIDDQRLSAAESKLAALYPLTPDVNKLVEWAEIFTPANTTQRVREATGYSLIADYRSDSDRYESTGVTYDNTGTNVVTYSGLSENLQRTFGFLVSNPANQVLLWLVDGATRIPFIDITSAGNFRVNNYREVINEGDHITNQLHFLTRTSGDAVVTTAVDSKSTFTVTPFPTGATETSRTMQIGIDVYVNGSNTFGEHIADITDVPSDNSAQSRNTLPAQISLGPLHGNRVVNVVIGYEFRVSGSDLLVDFTLVSAPSDVSIQFDNVATFLNYTAPDTTTRVDNFQIFGDGGGNYVFSGNTNILFAFHPYQINNSMNVVPVAINSAGTVTELNDITVPIPAHSFDSVEIPDTFEFRTFIPDHFLTHNDLAHIITRASTKWCYGLALLETVSEHRIAGELEFNTYILIGSPNGTRVRVSLDDSNAADLKLKMEEV